MKIERLSCGQFAGLINKELNLQDGLNVICGPNESGKSSMVNLLVQILFRSSKVGYKSTIDKEFRRDYFPVQRENSNFEADTVDGELIFCTDKGKYKLSKEWGDSLDTVLVNPLGERTKHEEDINNKIKKIFKHGEGVYRDMLFSSQKNATSTLETLLKLDDMSAAKEEIAKVAAKAFSESDGISVDILGDKIQEKINALQGEHWDLKKNEPEYRSTKERWKQKIGEVHKAYYEWEDANEVKEEIKELERNVEDATEAYRINHKEEKNALDEYDKFSDIFTELAIRSEKDKRLDGLEKEKEKCEDALKKWPEVERKCEEANSLKIQLRKRDILNKYEKLCSIKDKQSLLNQELLDIECPEIELIKKLQDSQKKISKLENKLCGMNLNANIELFDGHEMEIVSLRTGKKLDISADTAITEAVKIVIPGIMEMILSPANVNVDEINSEIEAENSYINSELRKYKVSSIEELDKLRQNVKAENDKLDDLCKEFKRVLGEEEFDDIKDESESINEEVSDIEIINTKIKELCGAKTLESFIGAQESVIQGYVDEYKNMENLNSLVAEKTNEISQIKEQIEEITDIPEEFKNISDPDKYKSMLKEKHDNKKAELDKAHKNKIQADEKLDLYMDKLENNPDEEITRTLRIFEEKKELLKNWIHIKEVYLKNKENIQNNPMEELANYFTDNLNAISDGNVRTKFIYDSKLSPGIYSNDRPLDYNKLSEGTKECVSLAFRLAVLDYLFPEGNGIAVFDDPFTNMDDERMKHSVELIKESSKKHQIILLTCRREYAELLSGNIIEM